MSSLLDALIAAEEFPPLKGDRGAKGDVGDKGDKGDTGYQGLEGPTGPMGPDGPVGPGGPEGPEGKRGPKGLKGDDGEKGDKGDEGPPGRDGGVAGGRSYNVRGFASGMVIDDEGTKLNSGAVVGEIDFVGSGVSTAIVGSKAVVTVAGGSGLPSGGTVGQVVTNTGPGTGTWQTGSGLPPQWTDGGNGDVTAEADAGSTPLTVLGNDTTTPVVILQGAPGSTALATDLLRVLDSETGDRIADIDADGSFVAYDAFGERFAMVRKGAMRLEADPAQFSDGAAIVSVGQTGGFSPLFVYAASTLAQSVQVSATATGQRALSIAAFDATEDGGDLINGVGAPNFNGGEFRVTAGGAIVTAQHVAPADANLAAGQMAVWFDQTNGAAALKIKGKTADGTVVTATIPLT